jgi:aminopeptidase N
MRAALAVASMVVLASCGGPSMRAVAPADRDTFGSIQLTPAHALALPEGVTLERVNLRLRVDPEAESFSGVSELALRLESKQKELLIHAEALEIVRARLEVGDVRVDARIEATAVPGVMGVRLPDAVGPGAAVLRVEYRASLSDSLEGLYRVVDGAGRYALTQMQPLAARRVFPSFDQMHTKVPYALALEVPERMIAVANTEVASRRSLGDGFDLVTFAPTAPLPSYLVAFAVGPFDVVSGTPLPTTALRDARIPIRGLATRGRGIELRYALDHVRPAFEALEKYFGRAAPIAKLDMLAAPDFAAGAMENPGLLLFRDSILLLPKNPDSSARRLFALVVAHELAHLWFGNLVTPARFEDLWLNEAFATHLAYAVVSQIHPEHRADILRARSANRAKEVDELPGARAILRPVENVHDVKGAFDVLTYEKGAALLFAFEAFLGGDLMREVISTHVRTNEHAVTRTEDFMAVLEAVAPAEVVESLRAHLERAGVPRVSFSLRCERDGNALHLRQLSAGADEPPFPVALCVRLDDTRTCRMFAAREELVPLAKCPSRLEPNAGGAGYYRAVLDDDLYDRYLARSLSRVSAAENVAFFGDATARFHEGSLPYDRYLALLSTLGTSSDEALASLPLEPLRFIYDEVAGDAERAAIEALLRDLYLKRLVALGFEAGKTEDADRARAAIGSTLLGRVPEPDLTSRAVERARAVIGFGTREDPDALAPGLRAAALRLALEAEGEAFFDALVARFRSTVRPSERADLLRALGGARDGSLATRALEFVFDPAVRRNEVVLLLGAHLARPEGRARAFEFLIGRWDELVRKIGAATAGSLASLVAYACDLEQVEALESVLARKAGDVEGGPRFLAAGAAHARDCAARVATERAAIGASKR